MKIRFVTAPTYVCEHHVKHHDAHLAAFIGLELEAQLDEGSNTYQVKLREVLQALTKLSENALVAVAYWSDHWLRVQLMLDEYVYFPTSCCQAIVSSGDTHHVTSHPDHEHP